MKDESLFNKQYYELKFKKRMDDLIDNISSNDMVPEIAIGHLKYIKRKLDYIEYVLGEVEESLNK